MRHLVCMSADIYCQITNNFYLHNNIILYSNGKKGKRASCRRDRERESMCARDGVAENGVGVCCKMAVGRRINYFGISREPNTRITFSWETILMRKGQRYIKITKIEIIFADAWWHLVMTTFHLHFPYLFIPLFQPEAAAPAARPLAVRPSQRASPGQHSSVLQVPML